MGLSGGLASNGGSASGSRFVPFSRPGVLAVESPAAKFVIPVACTLVSARAIVGTAPTGATLIVDVLKNGSTVFTTTANRPTVAISGTASGAAVPDIAAVAAGDYFTIQIVQVGATIAGADLTVVLLVQ